MTKLKNTKKGMAKKALSISLVAAMLATSNVPVWAAEFSDGTDVVDVVEAPVVEETPADVDVFSAEAAATQEVADEGNYTVTAKINGVENGAIKWNNANVNATFEIKRKDVNVDDYNLSFHYVWKKGGTYEEKDIVKNIFDGQESSVSITTPNVSLTENDCNSTLQLYIFATDMNNNDKTVWSYSSDIYEIAPINVSELYKSASASAKTYNGQAQVLELSDIILTTPADATVQAEECDAKFAIVQTNPVAATEAASFTLVPQAKGYTGQIAGTFVINQMPLDSTKARDHIVASLKTTVFEYTGETIRLKKDDIALTDKDTKDDLSNYILADAKGYVPVSTTDAINVDDKVDYANVSLITGVPTSGVKNYTIAAGTTVQTDNAVTVKARNLSTVTVSIKSKTNNNGQKVTLDASDISFKDSNGAGLNLYKDVDIVVPDNATSTGTYSVTIKPKDGNKNVTGTTTATLRIVTADISAGVFAKESNGTLAAREYTGEQIIITKDDLGALKVNDTEVGPEAYEIVNGTNTDVSTGGTVIIKGLGSYQGSQKVLTFDINPATVSSHSVTNNKVEKINTSKPSDYKDSMGIVVKAKNAAVPAKEFTLTEGKDYKVDYSWPDGNTIGKTVEGKITLINSNFKIKNPGVDNDKVVGTVESTITAKNLKSEYIKLKETDFTYSGVEVKPAFDVVIDGKVINPSLYTVSYTNNLNAGTATLTIAGKGDNNYSTAKASVNFTIKPADTTKLEGVIGSKEYTGYSLTLNPADIYLTLNKAPIDVASNFSLTFGENIQIGNGTVTLTPKNGNFTGTKTLTFKIVGEALDEGGTFMFYDETGKKLEEPEVNYDGTAHTFSKVKFAYNEATKRLTEGTDYDLVYVDNVYGKEYFVETGTDEDGNPYDIYAQYGVVLAVAKGKYGSSRNDGDLTGGVYTDAKGNKITNVIAVGKFKISTQGVSRSNITVVNGTYAGGLPVKPVVSVIVKGVTLVEGQDYNLHYDNGTNATTGKPYDVWIEPKNGYHAEEGLNYNWGIDKFNLANADVTIVDGKLQVKCGKIDIDASEYTTTVNNDGTTTIAAVSTSKNYTGSKIVDSNGKTDAEKPAAPMITNVQVTGNNAKVILSGESDGATGYDYVISTDRNCITTKDYDKVNKNVLTTNSNFTYTEQGVYYAYCHAWKRVNGVKVFSDWSNAYPFSVSAVTPAQPGITSVKVSGSTVTVTYTKCANATGYDVVLGSAVKKVNGERRPVEYGTLVKKIKKGNTVTATFKNVPKGTYYAGLHSWNRTSENGKKVFSPWSNTKKVNVK